MAFPALTPPCAGGTGEGLQVGGSGGPATQEPGIPRAELGAPKPAAAHRPGLRSSWAPLQSGLGVESAKSLLSLPQVGTAGRALRWRWVNGDPSDSRMGLGGTAPTSPAAPGWVPFYPPKDVRGRVRSLRGSWAILGAGDGVKVPVNED